MAKTPKEVISLIKDKDLKFVDVKFIDVPGTWQHVCLHRRPKPLGVARRDDKYYVFDPDRGLEELLSTTEFKQHIEKDYAKYIKDDGWTLVQVEPDPKQLHLVVPPKGK